MKPRHIPLLRRQDIKGFVYRKPLWLVRPLGLAAVRKETELMELETRRFYERAARHATDASVRQLLGDLLKSAVRGGRLSGRGNAGRGGVHRHRDNQIFPPIERIADLCEKASEVALAYRLRKHGMK